MVLQIVPWLWLVGVFVFLPATHPCELSARVEQSPEKGPVPVGAIKGGALLPSNAKRVTCPSRPSRRCSLRSCLHAIPTPPSAPLSAPKTSDGGGLTCSSKGLDAVLTAIERIMDFNEGSVHGIAAADRKDAIVGLVILQGQLVDILASRSSSDLRLRHLLRRVQAVTPKIFESSLRDVTQERALRLRALLKPNLFGPRASRPLTNPDPVLENIGDEEDVFDVELNFECLSDLALNCSVSTQCEGAYLQQPQSQYMLTHQVAFLNIAWHRNCLAVVSGREELLDRLCTKTYAELQFLAANGFPARFRDLSSEQVMLCGLAGYSTFMRADWLRAIMSWQSQGAVGCYPNLLGGYCGDSVVKVQYTACEGGEEGVEECLVHMTAVSLGAMAVNLKYMIDNCPAL